MLSALLSLKDGSSVTHFCMKWINSFDMHFLSIHSALRPRESQNVGESQKGPQEVSYTPCSYSTPVKITVGVTSKTVAHLIEGHVTGEELNVLILILSLHHSPQACSKCGGKLELRILKNQQNTPNIRLSLTQFILLRRNYSGLQSRRFDHTWSHPTVCGNSAIHYALLSSDFSSGQ